MAQAPWRTELLVQKDRADGPTGEILGIIDLSGADLTDPVTAIEIGREIDKCIRQVDNWAPPQPGDTEG